MCMHAPVHTRVSHRAYTEVGGQCLRVSLASVLRVLGDWSQVARLGGRPLCSLSHFSDPKLLFLRVICVSPLPSLSPPAG